MKLKVLVEGLWTDEADGWAIALRAYARALAMAGANILLKQSIGVPMRPPSEAVLEELRRAGVEILDEMQYAPKADVHITSFCMRGPDFMLGYLDKLVRALDAAESSTVQVFHTMSERDRIAPSIAAYLVRFDDVWVPCRANAVAFGTSGVWTEKLFLAPMPFFEDDPFLAMAKEPRIPSPGPSYYWIGRWEPRKDPPKLLRAFCRAFRPGEARLTLKASLPFVRYRSFPNEIEPALGALLALEQVHANGWTRENLEAGGVRVLMQRVSAEAIRDLHRTHRTYVSPSHGEGIDLPAFAAKLAGNRLVCSRSGGPNDFAGTGDVLVGMAAATVADPHYEWEPTARWADYTDVEMVEALRSTREGNPTHAHDFPIDAFRADRVGARMLRRLEYLVERRGRFG